MQAAFLREKLALLEDWNGRRREVAARYLEGLANTRLVLPHVPDWAVPVWHLFVVRHADRDRLQARLTERRIGTMIHYPIPPHRQPAYAEMVIPEGGFPLAERVHDEVLSLPMWPQLSCASVDRVVLACREV